MEPSQERQAQTEHDNSLGDDTVDISMLGYISSLPVFGGEVNRVLAEVAGDIQMDQEMIRALLDMADEYDNYDYPSALFERKAGVFMYALFKDMKESLQ